MTINKYGNEPTHINGLKFDSKKEAKRWQELQLLQRAGKICELERQVPFELAPSIKYTGAKRATPALRYVADFTYFVNGVTRPVPVTISSRYTVEDVKGVKTSAYRIKKHLMFTVHGIEVRET